MIFLVFERLDFHFLPFWHLKRVCAIRSPLDHFSRNFNLRFVCGTVFVKLKLILLCFASRSICSVSDFSLISFRENLRFRDFTVLFRSAHETLMRDFAIMSYLNTGRRGSFFYFRVERNPFIEQGNFCSSRVIVRALVAHFSKESTLVEGEHHLYCFWRRFGPLSLVPEVFCLLFTTRRMNPAFRKH